MRKLSLALTLLMIASFPNGATGQDPGIQISELIGSYTYSGSFAGSTITIEPEGKFHIDSGDCTQEYFEAGTYEFKGGVISFATTKHTVKSHGQSDEEARDLLDPKVYREMYKEELPADYRKDELVPVKWGERLYLMHKESLIEFCNAINLGLEPRRDLGAEWYLGSFYLREGDEKRSASGPPSLPTDSISQLLKRPVEAHVQAILQDNDTQLAVINKGTEVGLRPGMRFVINDEHGSDPPNLWFKGLIVVSVDSHLAKLKVLPFLEIKIGDNVSSKYVDRRFR